MADRTQKPGMQHETTGLRVSVIVPVYNAMAYIARSLPPLIELLRNNEILEVIVVDDSSTDETSQVAAQMGAQVIPSGGRLGPGGARNCGANVAGGDVLWFVDADVVVEKDAAHTLMTGFSEPGVVAVFGSYDDRPPAQNFLSQYKNLVHHYYHHRTRREASTFWSGCGAVQKEAFIQVGGFNIELFKQPSVEDIELGYRLRDAGGRILLLPDLRATHLKEWRLLNLLHTEIFCRAIPWARLMLTRTGLHNDLNVTYEERVRAGLAGLLVIVLVCALLGHVPWWIPFGVGVVFSVANRQLFAFFYRRKGFLFALRATLFHQLYYLYSSAAFAWSWIEIRILRLHRR
ncbi:MAG: glycosyltransferase [Gammaproteobacteria bacterium]|nr:glycosyltransferase [Gammaproteobacteria bacterium]